MVVTAKIEKLEDGKLVLKPDTDISRFVEQKRPRRVEVRLDDGRTISADQRRKIFAIIRDISLWSGHEPEELRQYLEWDFCSRAMREWFSLSDCDMTTARELTQRDSEARTSYTNRVASRGTGTVNAIVSLLYSDVEGVTFAAGYQNDDDEKDTAGRPPHCIEIVVQGGSDEDVAGIIWENKSGGIRAYGSHYAYATDINGTRQYVEFTRVNDVYLLLSVKVTSAGGLDDDFEARIKSLLMEEILSAGTSVRLQKFIRPIMENVSGVDYIEIRGLLSERPDIEGVEDSAMLTGVVPVSINQQPVVTMNGIRVVKA